MAELVVLLVGKGNVLVECGGILRARRHRIKALIGSDAIGRSWANKAGIPHYEIDEVLGLKPPLQFDILLSIGNYVVIPDALLKLAKRISVNYHYGPLPEYAGLHVPSWAIFDGATEYAITWHRIGKLVDGGGILKRIAVPIDASDTALSLGLKCNELAVQSFAALIDELEDGRETETPQELGRRQYFSRHSQFPAEGLIDWSEDAKQTAALVRAADYGPLGSPLGWPKLSINGQFFAVRRASVGAPAAGTAPGEIVEHDASSGLQVATATRSIRLEALSTLEGETLVVDDIANENELRPGMRLGSASAEAK